MSARPPVQEQPFQHHEQRYGHQPQHDPYARQEQRPNLRPDEQPAQPPSQSHEHDHEHHSGEQEGQHRLHKRHRHHHHHHHHERLIRQEDHAHFLSRSSLKPGIRGSVKGTIHLLLGKSNVKEPTPERLDLLHRADRFFNSGFVGHVPGLGKEKKGRFWEEMDVVTKELMRRERHHGRSGKDVE